MIGSDAFQVHKFLKKNKPRGPPHPYLAALLNCLISGATSTPGETMDTPDTTAVLLSTAQRRNCSEEHGARSLSNLLPTVGPFVPDVGVPGSAEVSNMSYTEQARLLPFGLSCFLVCN